MNTKLISFIAIACIVGGLVGYELGVQEKKFGGTVEIYPTWYSNGVVVGSLGPKANEVDQIVSGNIGIGSQTLGPLGSTTSTTSTIQNVTSTAFMKMVAGDSCIVGDTQASGTAAFGMSFNILAVSSSIQNATVSIALVNGINATTTIATGTVRYTCLHTPF